MRSDASLSEHPVFVRQRPSASLCFMIHEAHFFIRSLVCLKTLAILKSSIVARSAYCSTFTNIVFTACSVVALLGQSHLGVTFAADSV